MPTGIYPRSEEYRKQCAERMKGNKNLLGFKHSEDTKNKLSEFQKTNFNSGRFKKGQIAYNKGIPRSEEMKKKQSIAMKGKSSPFKGKHHTIEMREDMSMARKGIPRPDIRGEKNGMFGRRGKLCPCYVDGNSTKPYASGFTKGYKNKVRKRDNKECQICFKNQESYVERTGLQFHIHHIDYSKDNHSMGNLVTLCPVCHAKTNRREERIYWQLYFIILLSNK
jgi:hypothetical protein